MDPDDLVVQQALALDLLKNSSGCWCPPGTTAPPHTEACDLTARVHRQAPGLAFVSAIRWRLAEVAHAAASIDGTSPDTVREALLLEKDEDILRIALSTMQNFRDATAIGRAFLDGVLSRPVEGYRHSQPPRI